MVRSLNNYRIQLSFWVSETVIGPRTSVNPRPSFPTLRLESIVQPPNYGYGYGYRTRVSAAVAALLLNLVNMLPSNTRLASILPPELNAAGNEANKPGAVIFCHLTKAAYSPHKVRLNLRQRQAGLYHHV